MKPEVLLLLSVCLKFLSAFGEHNDDKNHEWSWNATVRMKMPSDETTYWCSLHKGPDLSKKHHIISMNALLPDENAMKFTHHFSINMCVLPKDGSLDQMFEDSIDNGVLGSDCFKGLHNPGLSKLFPLCRQLLYAWAKGGQEMVFPESAGYPIGDNHTGVSVSSGQRYFKLQIHYNNPQKLENITFETGVQVHYTDLLRKHDMGMMLIGHGITKAMVVPPNTSQFLIAGHCSPKCTSKFPKEGLKVSNVFLHAHLSGRKIKLRHFRAGKELPWIDSNDHYDFNHQESKMIPSSSGKIRPGDHLICECEYDTTWKKGSVVLGGEGTRDEMCEAFVWYYPKVDVVECTSSYPMRDNLKDFGITSVFLVRKNKELLILEPTNLQGDYEESLSTKIDWNESFVRGLERKRRFGMHEAACVSTTRFEILRQKGKVKYPENSTNIFSGNACCMK